MADTKLESVEGGPEAELARLRDALDSALKRAEEAESHRDEVLAMAGHELRTPLTAILLHLQALRLRCQRDPSASFGASELSERLSGPIAQTKKVNELLDRLMDISRLRSATLHLQREAVDLSLQLAGALTRFESAAQMAGSILELAAAESVVAYVDPLRIDQVISNLLSNALKYGNGSKVSIRLRSTGEQAVIEVEDRGPGIPEGDRKRIFRRYERASSGHNASSLGLGLYLSSEIVKAHGGAIEVDSELGKGSVFRVTLPLRELG